VQRNVNDVSNPAQKPRTDDTIEDYEITSSDKRAAGERYRVYHDLVLRVRFDQIGRDQAFLYKNPRNRQSVEGQRETGSPSPAHQRPYFCQRRAARRIEEPCEKMGEPGFNLSSF